jgi:hypothetical protein
MIGEDARTGLCPTDRILKLFETLGDIAETHRRAQQPGSPDGKNYSLCEKRKINEDIQKIEEICGEIRSAVCGPTHHPTVEGK